MILEELSKKEDILHTSCLHNVDLLIMIMMLRRMIMSKSSGWWWCRPIVDQSFGWWWWWGWWWMTPTNSRRVSQKGQRRKSSCSILSPSGSRDHHVQTASGFVMIMIMRSMIGSSFANCKWVCDDRDHHHQYHSPHCHNHYQHYRYPHHHCRDMWKIISGNFWQLCLCIGTFSLRSLHFWSWWSISPGWKQKNG